MVVSVVWSSTASVESETLTTVASSCERKDPITATDVIFHTSGSSRSPSLGALGKGSDYLRSAAYTRQAREDLFKPKTVLFRVQACTGVFDHHKSKSQPRALARGRLDAVVRGDAGEDNGVDATVPELLLQVGPGKGAPVALGDEKVAVLEADGRSDLRRHRRYRLVTHVER